VYTRVFVKRLEKRLGPPRRDYSRLVSRLRVSA